VDRSQQSGFQKTNQSFKIGLLIIPHAYWTRTVKY